MSHLNRKSIYRDSWLPCKFPKRYSCKKVPPWSNSKWINNLQNPDPQSEFYILLQHWLEGRGVTWWHIIKWTLPSMYIIFWNCLGQVLGQQDWNLPIRFLAIPDFKTNKSNRTENQLVACITWIQLPDATRITRIIPFQPKKNNRFSSVSLGHPWRVLFRGMIQNKTQWLSTNLGV